jgi:hypothetical protein
LADIAFYLYGRFPAARAPFVADCFHTLHELGLKYHTDAVPGRFLYQAEPRGATAVVEAAREAAAQDFGAVVERVARAHWPHIFMALDIPREEARGKRRSLAQVPVTAAVRELPVAETPARYQGSPFFEVSLTLKVSALIDVEREEDAEQGLHWFVSQVFVPFFISREALYGRADFDPSGAREVLPRHLEKLVIPDFYFLNALGVPFVKKYGPEPFLNPKINPVELQKRWLMRTPEGAMIFRAKVEADRWNGPGEPTVDFHDWEGRFRIIEKIEPKKKGRPW